MSDRLQIDEFGYQDTQLIARCVREAGVYCEIHPFQSVDADKIERFDPRGIILSGGPASVIEGQSPAAAPAIFSAAVPVLGICYGEQTMAQQLGGQVEAGHPREFGRAEVEVRANSALFIDVFEAEAKKIGGAQFLAQGTLYPDVIESVSFTGGPSVTIKSHHKV